MKKKRSPRKVSFYCAAAVASLCAVALVVGCTKAPPSSPPSVPGNQQEPESAESTTAQERARELVGQMTLDEKIAYIGGDRRFYIRPIERLGIPEIKLADGPVGCRNWGPSTAYPASVALAASFDPELTRRVGKSIARDCRARGVHILLAPGMNMQRSPLNGRNFEYLGEDPLVARHHAVAFIRGVQGQGVMATAKHFVANNQEWDRHHVSSEVSERALREIYFPAFEGAVKDAGVGAIMTSYNLVNGAYGSHNAFLLREVLREQWGFEGLVMSDWEAVHDTLGGVEGGTDLEMPAAKYMSRERILPLIEDGTIDESAIDEKVENILTALIRFGFFDREQKIERPIDDPESAQVSLEAATKGLVLLENELIDGKPLLPLDEGEVKRIAVVGPNAHPAVHGGSGSAYTEPPHVVSLLEAVRKAAPDAEVKHHPGIRQRTGFGMLGKPVFEGPVKQEIFLGKKLEGKPVVVGETDRVNFLPDGKPPAEGVPAENYSVRWTGRVVLPQKEETKVIANADDGIRVFIDGEKVLDDWSDHAPRRTSNTVQLAAGEHEVVVEYFQGILGSIAQFGMGEDAQAGELYGKPGLVDVAKNADVVILALGYGQSADTNSLGTAFKPFWPPPWARDAGVVEAEDDDRTFGLPDPQLATLAAVREVNDRSVVVGFSGGGVDFEPWLAGVPAVLWAWYPGQEGGSAIAKTLFGDINPSGHLPVTFARKYADHPAAASYGTRLPLEKEKERGGRAILEACKKELAVRATHEYETTAKDEGPLYMSPYCEGVFVGYRGFDRADTQPLFPFGHGLSYTNFEYSKLASQVDDDGKITASVTVKNTGSRAGREVVQFYAAPKNSRKEQVPRPPQQLAGYGAVELAPGEAKTVTASLEPRAFGYYSTASPRGWRIPAGVYEVRASSSSRDHRVRAELQLQGRTLP